MSNIKTVDIARIFSLSTSSALIANETCPEIAAFDSGMEISAIIVEQFDEFSAQTQRQILAGMIQNLCAFNAELNLEKNLEEVDECLQEQTQIH